MNISLNKIAALLALIIGAMAVFAGGKVLLGKVPDYYVIDWLPVYNYTVGILTVLVTAILLWVNHKLAVTIASATFAIHTLVMSILQTAYREVVAMDSIVAMTIRMTVWVIILALLYIQTRRNRTIPI